LVLKKISFELVSVSFNSAVLDLSSSGRKLFSLTKWSSNELNFLEKLDDSYMKISTKFRAYWASGLRDMDIFLRMTEFEN